MSGLELANHMQALTRRRKLAQPLLASAALYVTIVFIRWEYEVRLEAPAHPSAAATRAPPAPLIASLGTNTSRSKKHGPGGTLRPAALKRPSVAAALSPPAPPCCHPLGVSARGRPQRFRRRQQLRRRGPPAMARLPAAHLRRGQARHNGHGLLSCTERNAATCHTGELLRSWFSGPAVLGASRAVKADIIQAAMCGAPRMVRTPPSPPSPPPAAAARSARLSSCTDTPSIPEASSSEAAPPLPLPCGAETMTGMPAPRCCCFAAAQSCVAGRPSSSAYGRTWTRVHCTRFPGHPTTRKSGSAALRRLVQAENLVRGLSVEVRSQKLTWSTTKLAPSLAANAESAAVETMRPTRVAPPLIMRRATPVGKPVC